jgi:hypothetical protein
MTAEPQMCRAFCTAEQILMTLFSLDYPEGEHIDQIVLDVYARKVIQVQEHKIWCFANHLSTPEFWCVIRFVIRHKLPFEILNLPDTEGSQPVRVTTLEGYPTDLVLACLTEAFERDPKEAFTRFYNIDKVALRDCIEAYRRRTHSVWRLLCMM